MQEGRTRGRSSCLEKVQTGKRSVTTSVTVRRRICASNQQLEILWNYREEILKGHTSHRMYAILRVWMEVSQVVFFSRVTGRQNTTTRRPPMHIQRTPHKHQRSSGSVSDKNFWHYVGKSSRDSFDQDSLLNLELAKLMQSLRFAWC